MRKPVLSLYLVLLLISPVRAETSFFDEAQKAASEGRYEDVVSILSTAIGQQQLEQSELAIAHSNRGIAYSLLRQYGPAVKDLSLAIELDPLHLLSINHLGILAEHVEEDYSKAAGWYTRAAEAGYAASQVNLGNLYRDGLGVTRDSFVAFHLYETAAKQDYPTAYVALGEMYMDGAGVAADYEHGLELLRRGIDSGVVTGHYYMGIASERGLGVAPDYKQAAEHYGKAAKQGHVKSQRALGFLYSHGNYQKRGNKPLIF